MKIKKKILRLNNIITDFYKNICVFKFNVSIWIMLEQLFSYNRVKNGISLYILKKKHCVIEDYLYHNYEDIVDEYRMKNSMKNSMNKDKIIWFFWAQGKSNMPDIVKDCYNSVIKNCGHAKVKFIDLYNYSSLIDIPNWVIHKFDKKIISFTHFSDILRVTLLAKYGGMWIDSTIFVSKTIPDFYFEKSFFTTKLNMGIMTCVSNARWNVQMMSGNSCIFLFIRDFLCEYWKNNNELIDYFLIDYIIDIAYNEFNWFKEELDSIELNNKTIFDMDIVANNQYNDCKFNKIINQSIFHKFNWRKEYHMYIDGGEKFTNFGYFMNLFN